MLPGFQCQLAAILQADTGGDWGRWGVARARRSRMTPPLARRLLARSAQPLSPPGVCYGVGRLGLAGQRVEADMTDYVT